MVWMPDSPMIEGKLVLPHTCRDDRRNVLAHLVHALGDATLIIGEVVPHPPGRTFRWAVMREEADV